MIGSITGIGGSTVSFNFDRTRDKGTSTLEDEEFAKGLGNHSRQSGTEGSKKKQKIEEVTELTPEEKEQVKELKKRDAHVRNHEMAHLAAAGSLARGGPNYEFQTGPDGRSYAIGGSVDIDTSPGNTPEETIAKAAKIRAAATAPSDPSPQDMKVASAAAQLTAEALQKISSSEEDEGPNGKKAPNGIGGHRSEDRISFRFSSELGRFNQGEQKGEADDDPSTPINRLIKRVYDSSGGNNSEEKPSLNSLA